MHDGAYHIDFTRSLHTAFIQTTHAHYTLSSNTLNILYTPITVHPAHCLQTYHTRKSLCTYSAHHPHELQLQPRPTLTDSLSRFSLSVPIRCDDCQAKGLNPKLHSKQRNGVCLNRSLPTSQAKHDSVATSANSSIKRIYQ